MVEQCQCGVTELRLLPLPAVLLQEKWRIFLELIQLSECVIQIEGQALYLMWQRIVGVIEGQAGRGVRKRGERGRVVGGCLSTFLWHDALTCACGNLIYRKKIQWLTIITQSKESIQIKFFKLFEETNFLNTLHYHVLVDFWCTWSQSHPVYLETHMVIEIKRQCSSWVVETEILFSEWMKHHHYLGNKQELHIKANMTCILVMAQWHILTKSTSLDQPSHSFT